MKTNKSKPMVALIFTADNKISDEACHAARLCGIDPNDLLPR